MSRKRCKRKPITTLGLSPIGVLIASQTYPTEEADRILLRLHSAYDDLCHGGTDDDLYDRVGAAINVGLIRAEQIGGSKDCEAAKVFVRAVGALMECDSMRGKHGKYGFTGPALTVMAEALALYAEILRASSPRQMADAVTECWRRVRAGHIERPSHVEA
jgi:hypothetical protein